jgi:hypothetical protein
LEVRKEERDGGTEAVVAADSSRRRHVDQLLLLILGVSPLHYVVDEGELTVVGCWRRTRKKAPRVQRGSPSSRNSLEVLWLSSYSRLKRYKRAAVKRCWSTFNSRLSLQLSLLKTKGKEGE